MNDKLRILMVEDVPSDAKLIERELNKTGIEFVSKLVETKEEFQKELKNFAPDLILSDYKLPSFDGISALEIAKEECSAVPFIFVSGSIGEDLAIDVLKRGATDYVLKDRLSKLGPTVQRALKEIRQEFERKKLEQQLIRAQKMEALGRLAGGIAHDFNNMIGVIIGYAELITNSLSENAPMRKDIHEIEEAARKASMLTKQLLAFSRKQIIQPQVMDLNVIVSEMKKMLGRLIGENIELNVVLAPNIEKVKVDKGQIEQVIMNLVINAVDAMPNGGTVTVKTSKTSIDREYSSVTHEARPGEFICLTIEDAGVGMDKELLNHIFEPFFTTKETSKGTGLGLSVVYGIMKQHEGWINVYSEPKQGTVFRCYFPVSSEKEEVKGKEAITLKNLRGHGERILFVEDDNGIRQFAMRVLSENSYIVFSAENVKEALEIFEKENGNFDLIFTDVVLPDKTGIELAEELILRKPSICVVICSGYTDERSQWDIIHGKGFQFIQKPYEINQLLIVIRKTIDKCGKGKNE